jgi:hypothetical protein
MRCGDFAAAWRVCDRVLQQRLDRGERCDNWPRHLQFVWNGRALNDQRVLVRCYHGLGDTLQFVRLLAVLRPRVRSIILWVQPCLLELLRGVAGVDRLLALHDGCPDVDYDVDIELMELLHVLRLSLADVPNRVPYLEVLSEPSIARPDQRYLNIGLAWRSGPWCSQRSIPTTLLTPLSRFTSVRWHSLQYQVPPPRFMVDIACQDLSQLAARLQLLDLIISVDTMTAHLAGALGLPTWTLLPHQCDWRWLSQRCDSPWYPTMRLFRQRQPDDWNSVLAVLTPELEQLTATRSRC